ncbi:MAG: membrane protein insertion efficiency factor YidD [Candidatus Methylomirabilales bacterium]
MQKNSSTPTTKIALTCIALYRRFVSPLFPPACRFVPTCSAYAEEAISRYGLVRGCVRVVRRLMRCHPLHPGGIDPVR